MQRSAAKLCGAIARRSACDVFINHCGADTKRNVAGLIRDNLVAGLGIGAFLDSRSMRPGDKLLEKIEESIGGCRVGVALLSPRYCQSYFCLYELALMVEAKKRLVPIFYDIQPSEPRVMLDTARYPARELHRFAYALREARFTVGITFDSSNGDWSELVRKASEAVRMNLVEAMEEETRMTQTVMKADVNMSETIMSHSIHSL